MEINCSLFYIIICYNHIVCCVWYFCVAVSIAVVPTKRESHATAELSEGEWKEFCNFFGGFTEGVCRFLGEQYGLAVTDIVKNDVKCRISSLHALEKFWSDLQNGLANKNFEEALHIGDTEIAIILKLSVHDYHRAKEFFASLDTTQPKHM